MKREKLSREALRGAIQVMCDRSSLTLKQISETLGVSIPTVQKWKNRESTKSKTRKRKGKLSFEVKRFIYKQAKDKFTGIEHASSRKLANRVNRKFKLDVCHSTINNYLRKAFKRPRRARTTFKLTDINKDSRKRFAAYILENNIKGRDIFFTDEKRFLLDTPLNPQSNQIRLCKKSYNKLKAGDQKIEEKISKPVPKFSSGFMVSVGLSAKGVGKLIFCVGTMNTFCYKQTLDCFKEDDERLDSDLLFQQDNARCHTSVNSMNHIGGLFGEKKLDFWPPNSPDLSPIETLWAIVQNKLQEKTYKTMDEQKRELIKIWNKIPKSLCERLCDSFDKKILQIAKTGKRYNPLQETQENTGKRENLKWNEIWNENDEIERIVYNDQVLKEHQVKAVKLITKQFLSERKNFNKEFKERYSKKAIKERKGTFTYAQLLKHTREGEIFEQDYRAMQKRRLERRDEIKNMTLEEYYNNLSDQMRIKLINERVTHSFDDFMTQADTEENQSDIIEESAVSEVEVLDENEMVVDSEI